MKKSHLYSGILLTGASSFTTQYLNAAQPTDSKPNIIYILADDLGYGDLSCYGQKRFSTPNIDKLASAGKLFTQHYAGSSVSAPSRSVLLTGLNTGHTPIRGNKEVGEEGQWPLPAASVTIAEILKKANYTTGAFGKWGLGATNTEGDPNNQGFDEFFGYKCQRMAHSYYPEHLWHNQQKVIIPENKGVGREVYAPTVIHEKAIEFIRKNKNNHFFLYYASTLPHAELAIPENYLSKFRNNFSPDKKFKGIDAYPETKNGGYASQNECHTAFAAMVTLLDEQVGQIVNELKQLGLSENTIIIFSSDNGPHREGGADPDFFDSNGPLKGFKRDLYEGGIRVPMIVSWPEQIKNGTISNHVSSFCDVLPTCVDLAGIKINFKTDGISFLPTLKDKRQPKHKSLYWEFHELGGRVALRMDKWKLVKYDVNKNPDKKAELYDLVNDIGETQNVADQHPKIVKKMEQIILSARTPSDVFKFGTN